MSAFGAFWKPDLSRGEAGLKHHVRVVISLHSLPLTSRQGQAGGEQQPHRASLGDSRTVIPEPRISLGPSKPAFVKP